MRMPMSFPAIDAGVGGLSAGWWNEINESVEWQYGIFFTLCAVYALVSSVAFIQLIRIELRVPEYGWTTQKVFHVMNFIVNGVRDVMFGFHKKVYLLHPKGVCLIWVPKIKLVTIIGGARFRNPSVVEKAYSSSQFFLLATQLVR